MFRFRSTLLRATNCSIPFPRKRLSWLQESFGRLWKLRPRHLRKKPSVGEVTRRDALSDSPAAEHQVPKLGKVIDKKGRKRRLLRKFLLHAHNCPSLSCLHPNFNSISMSSSLSPSPTVSSPTLGQIQDQRHRQALLDFDWSRPCSSLSSPNVSTVCLSPCSSLSSPNRSTLGLGDRGQAYPNCNTQLTFPFDLREYGSEESGDEGPLPKTPHVNHNSAAGAAGMMIESRTDFPSCDDSSEKTHFHSLDSYSADAGDSSLSASAENLIFPGQVSEIRNGCIGSIKPSTKRTSLSRSSPLTADEDASFNSWQYWRVPLEFDSPPPHPTKGQGRARGVAAGPCNEDHDDDCPVAESSEEEGDELCELTTYVLTPCSECDSNNNEISSFRRHHPLTFWASGLNFCGHPRQLIRTRMGNQPGKEKEAVQQGTNKKPKSFGLLRRGDTKGSLQSGSSASSPPPNAPSPGLATIKPGSGITKNRAPPPPPPPVNSGSTGVGTTTIGIGNLAQGNNLGEEQNLGVDLDRQSLNGSSRRGNSSLSNNYNQSNSQIDLSLSLEDGDYSLSEDNSSCTLADTYQTAFTGKFTLTHKHIESCNQTELIVRNYQHFC